MNVSGKRKSIHPIHFQYLATIFLFRDLSLTGSRSGIALRSLHPAPVPERFQSSTGSKVDLPFAVATQAGVYFHPTDEDLDLGTLDGKTSLGLAVSGHGGSGTALPPLQFLYASRSSSLRPGGRGPAQLRPLTLTPGYVQTAEGSVLVNKTTS